MGAGTAAETTDQVAADVDLLDGFVVDGGRERAPLVDDLPGLQHGRRNLVAGCGSRAVESDALDRLDALLAAMGDNEQFAAGVALALRSDDTIGASPGSATGTLSAPAERVDRQLEEFGVVDAPPLIEAGPIEFHGLPPTSGFVDDPVCAANGNFVHGDHDLGFPGLASVLDAVRFYNSLGGRRPGLFGRGWTSLLDMAVEGDRETGLVRVRLGDGSLVPFVKTRDGAWRLSGRRRLALEEAGDGWLLHDGLPGRRSDRTWSFGTDGLLRRGTAHGARFRVDRSNEAITVVETTSGRSITHELDERGLVIRSVASDGRQVRFHHDSGGHCVRVERPRGALWYRTVDGLLAAIHDADGVLVCHNTYDDRGRVTTQLSPNGRLTHYDHRSDGGLRVVDDETGLVNAFVHDGRGNLTSIIDGAGRAMRIRYDDLDRPVRITDRAGATTRYRYADHLAGAPADLLVERIDPDGRSHHWEHDEAGRVVAEVDRSGARTVFHHPGPESPRSGPTRIDLPGGGRVQAAYDRRGLPLRVVDPDGVVTSWVWDRDGELAAMVDGAGRRTTWHRDRFGRLVGVTGPDGATVRLDADGQGRLRSVTHPDGTTDHYTWTPAGRPLRRVSDGPRSWRVRYGPTGRPVEFVDGTGATVHLRWNRNGDLAEVLAPDGARHRYRYSPTGRVTAAIDPAGGRTEQAHDAEDRVVAITLPDGRRASRTLDPLGRTVAVTGFDGSTTELRLHPDGSVAERVDADGARNRTELDAAGRVVAAVDPAGGRTRYEWSPAGRLQSVTTPAGRTWRARRDAAGELVAIVDPDGRVGRPAAGGAHPAAGEFGFDRRGLVDRATDPAGIATRIVRDVRGRITGTGTAAAGPASTALACDTALAYDDAGRPAAWTDPLGNVRRLGVSPDGRVIEVDPGDGLGARYQLDGGGRPVGAGGPTGDPLVEWIWSPGGRLVSATTGLGTWQLERDPLGRLRSVDHPFGSATIERDADGLVAATVDPLGRVDRVRTPGGRLLGFRVGPVLGAPIGAAPADGDVSRPGGGALPLPPAGPVPSTDERGRITVDRHGRSHRYDRAGRLVATVAADGRAWSFDYDELGRLSGERTPGGRRRFAYDAASRPIELEEVAGPARSRTTFGSDVAGRRIVERRSDGRVVRYRWNPLDQLIGITTIEADGTAHHRRIDHDPRGRPVLVDGETVITWDDAVTGKVVGIGSLRVLRAGLHTRVLAPGEDWTDGTVDDPWGHEPGAGVRIGYRGELTIDGLVFMGARVYDPATRSFLSPDPRPPVAGRSAFASPYVYAWCDPVNHLDPSGERPVDLATYQEIREREEGSRFGRAWDAITDDPWASIGVVGLVVVGGVLCFTPLAPVGAGILVGAGAAALGGLAADDFDPRKVAVSAVIGGISGGTGAALAGTSAGIATSIGIGAATAGGESVATQVFVEGSSWDEIDWGRVTLDGIAGGVTAGAAHRIGTAMRARAAAGTPPTATPPAPSAVAPVAPADDLLHSPGFVVHPNGEAVVVPTGAVGPSPADNGLGFRFAGGSGGPGLDARVTSVRIMDPVVDGKYLHPTGYVNYANSIGQTVDPWTGRTLGRSDPMWHWDWSE